MPNKIANRVKMTVSGTPGTGTITLGSAVAGFQSFAGAGVSNSDTVPYVIEDGSSWELGVGTYTATGTSLSRSVTASSNSGNPINATSAAIVMISPLAADLQSGTAANNLVRLDGSSKLPAVDGSALTGVVASSMAASGLTGTLGVASGGTGLSSLASGRIPYGNGTGAFSNSANLVFDGSNLGLGVTPSTWSAGKAIELATPGYGLSTGYGSGVVLSLNAYYNSGFKYGVTAPASYYSQGAGAHNWFTAASGTAGNAISFTQAMTLDASGRLVIGDTTTSYFLRVKGGNTNSMVIDNGGQQYTELDFANNGTNKASMWWDNTATQFVLQSGVGSLAINASSTSAITFGTVSGSERAKLGSDGVLNVCSAVATPASGSTSARLIFGTTAGFGIYYGSGAPTVSAAQGSIYLRSDGSSTSTRLYVNTNGSTTWTNVTTAA